MPEQDLYELMGNKEHTGQIRERWMIGIEALVAVNEDPEHQHRIKVVIPMIDEEKVHDRWIKRAVWWTGAAGYGDFHPPEIGSEVILFGRTGMKHNIYYASVFNEDFLVPMDFWGPMDRRGFRTDGDYKSIVELDHFIRAGRILIEADSSVRIMAPGGLFINNKRVDEE